MRGMRGYSSDALEPMRPPEVLTTLGPIRETVEYDMRAVPIPYKPRRRKWIWAFSAAAVVALVASLLFAGPHRNKNAVESPVVESPAPTPVPDDALAEPTIVTSPPDDWHTLPPEKVEKDEGDKDDDKDDGDDKDDVDDKEDADDKDDGDDKGDTDDKDVGDDKVDADDKDDVDDKDDADDKKVTGDKDDADDLDDDLDDDGTLSPTPASFLDNDGDDFDDDLDDDLDDDGSTPAPTAASFVDEGLEPGREITFEVSKLNGEAGDEDFFIIRTNPKWAPLGVERFHKLVDDGFYNECRFFRVVPDFVVQFGMNGDPNVQEEWSSDPIKDDPVSTTNARGTVSFATSGPDTRTTQVFINTKKEGNSFLDDEGFSPIGEVIDGMKVVDKIYSGYGEQPEQEEIKERGNAYLDEKFPKLTYIVTSYSN